MPHAEYFFRHVTRVRANPDSVLVFDDFKNLVRVHAFFCGAKCCDTVRRIFLFGEHFERQALYRLSEIRRPLPRDFVLMFDSASFFNPL